MTENQPKLTEIGYECIPGKSWQYTAGVVAAAMEKVAAELVAEREWSAAVGAEVMRLREQLERANNTIDKLTED